MNMSKWTKALLDDVCQLITDGSHFSPPSVECGFPMVSVKDFSGYGFDFTNCRQISQDDYNTLVKNGCMPEIDDILIGKDGARYFEDVIIFKQKEKPVLLSSIAIIRADTTIVIPKFLYYYLFNKELRQQVKDNLGSGSAIPRMVLKDFKRIPTAYPDIKVQRAIAATLSRLDDKIELNNRINANLEAQAQAIFKSWFVDFEPFQDGEFVDSELGMIPKGWRVGRLGDVVEIQNRTFKPNSDSMIVEHYSIPAYDEHRFPIFEEASCIKSNKFYVNTDCFLISKLNPDKKRIWRPLCLTSHAVCSTEFIVYKARNSGQMMFYYSLVDGIEFFNFLTSHVTGSTGSRQRATPKDTMEFKFALPSNELVDDFVDIVAPVYKEIDALSIENVKLELTRDALLPKLMSGEIEVPVEG